MKLTPKKGGSRMTAIVRVDPILEEFERVFGDLWTPWNPVIVTGSVGMQLDVHGTKGGVMSIMDTIPRKGSSSRLYLCGLRKTKGT